MSSLSHRLREIVDALPLEAGMRVIEIGCGPGAAAREVAIRVGPSGHVLAVDRSQRAIDQVMRTCGELISAGRLSVKTSAAEDLVLDDGAQLFDLAFAVRVGAFDGRHPERYDEAVRRVRAALVPNGRLFIDGGDPLRELALPRQNGSPRQGTPRRA
jgi:cyclopropane fatty-acyl-phospholipid synthase-like methyltransferase